MASVCQRCGKGKMWGNLVSHAKNRTHRIWKPNLQPVHVSGRKLWLCTKCVRIVRKQEKEKKQ